MKVFNNRSYISKTVLYFIGICLVLLSILLSISYGSTKIAFAEILHTVFNAQTNSQSEHVIQEIRIPRAISAALTGAFLAVSGALMQGMTRNALASPSIMGITDGAAFFLVIVLAFFPSVSSIGTTFAAFIGAGIAAVLIFFIGSFSSGGLTSVKLVLAGVAIGTLLRSLSSVLALHFQLEKDMGFWLAGGLDSANWDAVKLLLVAGLAGMIIALSISRSITVLNLGDDLSTGLGQNNFLIRIAGVLAILLLTGVSVSVAGAIGFVGLIVPHITRFIVGTDYRWIIPASAIFGALLLVNADLVARLINAPFETPVGAITSILGVPFFLYLARNSGGEAK